ncbi:M13 family metallopeptidase [Porphyromonadaceae sp. NP-X]|nr:M13 family metallopeptidase [Porphyromonadaceae sp. NP-X]
MMLMMNGCKSEKKISGIDLTNLDTTARPGDDFYQFACRGWMKKNPLKGEYARYGTFDKLAEENTSQLRELIEEIASKSHVEGTVEQKIGDLYQLAMDSDRLNREGYQPVQTELKKLAGVKTNTELIKILPELMLNGNDVYFSVYVDADPMNSSVYLTQTYQSGISLEERDYYLDQDTHSKEILEKYKQHVAKMFELFGFNSADAQKNRNAVLYIETRLAKASYDRVKLRDPYANYHKMSIQDLSKEFSTISWNEFLHTLGIPAVDSVNVSQKEFLTEVGNILTTVPLDQQIAYLQWKVIDNAAAYLSDSIYNQNFEFYGKTLSGKKEPSPRWKRSVRSIDNFLGEAVGQMYVKKYFPPEAKESMLKLVHNLQESLGQRIQNLTWMGDSTKAKALEKLGTFYVKIGYPDKWRSYDALQISNNVSYYENVKRAHHFEYAYKFARAGNPVDKSEWLMTPQTVNAYYNPSTNEICFPAGILQPPFFDVHADDAANYGAIGVVIGHEMTHGFDDQGCQFDKDGNLKNWWTEEDKKQFDARAKVLADYYDSIEVAPGVHANGKFTLGENIADHGGLQVSFQAYKNSAKGQTSQIMDGFTPEQRFFLSYANVWAGNIRPEEILVLTKSDPHALGRWRVNGALPHIQAWYDAFGIKEGDKLFLPVEKRVSIW